MSAYEPTHEPKLDANRARHCTYSNCKSIQVKGCTNNIVFHKFPKTEAICRKWVQRCGRLDLLNKSSHIIHNVHKLCSRHFDDGQYFNLLRRRLIPNALPSIFITVPKFDSIPTSSLPSSNSETNDRDDSEILSRGKERRNAARIRAKLTRINLMKQFKEKEEIIMKSNSNLEKSDKSEMVIKEERETAIEEETFDNFEESMPFEFINIKTEEEIKEEKIDEEIDEFYNLPESFLEEEEESKKLSEEEGLSNFMQDDDKNIPWKAEQFVNEAIVEEISAPSDQIEKESTEHSFVCFYCGFKSKSKEDVVSHVRSHLVIYKYKCVKCDYKTNYPDKYTEHLEQEGHFLFQCDECDFKTDDLDEQNFHPSLHSKDKIFRCSKCKYKTRYKKCLMNHVEKHKYKKFACSKCTFETNSRVGIEKHMMKHATKNVCRCSGTLATTSDNPKDPEKVDGRSRVKLIWSVNEYLEVLWCYRYATHRFFSKKGVSQRHRLMLLKRNKIDIQKLDFVSDLMLSDLALNIRIFRTSVTREQISAVDLDVEEFMKRSFSKLSSTSLERPSRDDEEQEERRKINRHKHRCRTLRFHTYEPT